jgi:hypothetical protein
LHRSLAFICAPVASCRRLLRANPRFARHGSLAAPRVAIGSVQAPLNGLGLGPGVAVEWSEAVEGGADGRAVVEQG